MTRKNLKIFLAALAAGDTVSHACASINVARQTMYDHRDHDFEFLLAWDDAVRAGTDVLIEEARRRAVDGWQEPVFWRGEETGAIRKFSDSLLMFLIKQRDPTFRDRIDLNHSGEIMGGGVTIYLPERRPWIEEPSDDGEHRLLHAAGDLGSENGSSSGGSEKR